MISYDLAGKVFLVTGGSRGIGLEIARHLLQQNARVAICARKQEGLDAAMADLQAGDEVLAVPAHVAREEDVDNLFAQVKEKFGRLDVLVNNVGMNIMTSAVADVDYSLWNKIIDSNLNGAFLCASRAAAMMREQKEGKIVNISSLAAHRAASGMGVYGIAKAGVEMLTRVLAVELADSNIQVNAVAPSMVRTEFSQPFWSDPAIHDEIVKGIPMGRIAEPEDIAHMIMFLSSSAADFITGQTYFVDGGSTAK